MNDQITIAIITAGATITVAVISFFLNERAKRKADWQQKKFGHYEKLLLALSELAIEDSDKDKANLEFAAAFNTITLIASQEVITALMAFHDEIKFSNKNRSSKKHDELLKELVLAIRKDIGLSKKDNPASFNIHLTGSIPKK